MEQVMTLMKSDVTTSLFVRVHVPAKQRALRLRDMTGKSLPQTIEAALEIYEKTILAKQAEKAA
jgi:hypothetical protein